MAGREEQDTVRELGLARWLMNRGVREALESSPVFDPASLDACPANALPPAPFTLVDDALAVGDDAVSVVCGRIVSRGPWEVLP